MRPSGRASRRRRCGRGAAAAGIGERDAAGGGQQAARRSGSGAAGGPAAPGSPAAAAAAAGAQQRSDRPGRAERAEELVQPAADAVEQRAGRRPAAPGQARDDQMRQLGQEKDELRDGVGGLEQQLDKLGRQALSNGQRDAARKLQEASGTIRDRQVKEIIDYSKQLMADRERQRRRVENLLRPRNGAPACRRGRRRPRQGGRRVEASIAPPSRRAISSVACPR